MGGTEIEVVDGRHTRQSMSGDTGAHPEYKVKTLMTPDLTALQERSSGYGRTGICRSS